MHPNRQVREFAVQVLFLWDSLGVADAEVAQRSIDAGTVIEAQSLKTAFDPATREKALTWARAAWDKHSEVDARIEYHAPQWPPKRQPGVDRAILRLAAWELNQGDTDAATIIDEAVELAKLYSTEHSPAFVNGVLDALRKEIAAVTAT
jgi:transcription antitermination protein NusB